MNKINKIILLLLMLTLASAFEVNGDGSPADYSKIAVSSRYWGMGKVGVGFMDDAGGILLNPGGLGRIRSMEFSSMSTSVLGEFNYSLLNYVYPMKNETLAFSYLYEDAGTIYATDGLDSYGHPVKGDKIENYNRVISLGYGRQVWDKLYLGTMFKFYNKRLGYVTARAMAADIGLMYRWNEIFSLGLTAKNALQDGIRYSNDATPVEPLANDYVFGVAWSLFEHNLTIGIDQHSDNDLGKTHIGAEYWWSNAVAFRGGFSQGDITLGLGFRYDMFQVDYALRYQEAPLDNQAYISFTYGNARKSTLTRPEIEIVERDNMPDDKAKTTEIISSDRGRFVEQ